MTTDIESTFVAMSGCGRIELVLTKSDAESCAQGGKDATDDVLALRKLPYVARQIAKWDMNVVRQVLQTYGAWDEGELADNEENTQRMVWSLACDIAEGHCDRDE